MKDYFKIEVPFCDDWGHWNIERYIAHEKFPFIYLKRDFSHYLSKNLVLTNVVYSIGEQKYRGFRTHYIADKNEIVTKIKATELSRFMVTDVLKDDGEWLYVFNKELRLG